MSPPKIGVLIPTFNHSAFVAGCLESIVADSCESVPIVVRDDASTDATVPVVQDFMASASAQGREVMLDIHEENLGSVETLNRGVESTDWDWIVLCNSDDEFGVGRFQAIRHAIDGDSATEWGFSRVEFIDAKGVTRVRETKRWQDSFERSMQIWGSVEFGLLTENFAQSTGNLFFRRSLWERLGGFHELSHVHDWDFALRAMTHSPPTYISQCAYRYRLHAANTFESIPDRVSRQEVARVYERYTVAMKSARSRSAPSPINYPGLWKTFRQVVNRPELP